MEMLMASSFKKAFFKFRILKSLRLIPYFTIVVFLSAYIDIASADPVCKKRETMKPDEIKAEEKKTTFCFFSLNNPEEVETLSTKYKNDPNVEVKEFYPTPGKSVKESFKKMMENQFCDALVISGHHTGFFAGKKSISPENDSQILELDFMEEMACEEGCEEWFSNVNSLFLMGCQTIKTDERLQKDKDKNNNDADSETIRVIAGESQEGGTQAIYADQHIMVNQAYSSTLDQNNQLSHRYLRMFPNSSLYGWGEKAPGKSSGSQNSLPNFIDLVENIQKPNGSDNSDAKTEETDDILNFIGFMNSQDKTCKKYTAGQWTKHWTTDNNNRQPTACYLDFKSSKDKERFKGYHKKGCKLAKAIKDNDKEEIITIVHDILMPDEDKTGNIIDTDGEEIKANFNRLMSLIISKENKDKPWYQEVKDILKENVHFQDTVTRELKSDKVGFTRKADYLYFYKEMGWGDGDSEEKKAERTEISQKYLAQLQDAFDNIDKKEIKQEVKTAHHYSLFTSIAQNKLGKWLSENDPEGFKELQKQFLNSSEEWDQIPGHFLSHLGRTSKEDIKTANTFLKEQIKEKSWFNGYICERASYIVEEIDLNNAAEEIELFDCGT